MGGQGRAQRPGDRLQCDATIESEYTSQVRAAEAAGPHLGGAVGRICIRPHQVVIVRRLCVRAAGTARGASPARHIDGNCCRGAPPSRRACAPVALPPGASGTPVHRYNFAAAGVWGRGARACAGVLSRQLVFTHAQRAPARTSHDPQSTNAPPRGRETFCVQRHAPPITTSGFSVKWLRHSENASRWGGRSPAIAHVASPGLSAHWLHAPPPPDCLGWGPALLLRATHRPTMRYQIVGSIGGEGCVPRKTVARTPLP